MPVLDSLTEEPPDSQEAPVRLLLGLRNYMEAEKQAREANAKSEQDSFRLTALRTLERLARDAYCVLPQTEERPDGRLVISGLAAVQFGVRRPSYGGPGYELWAYKTGRCDECGALIECRRHIYESPEALLSALDFDSGTQGWEMPCRCIQQEPRRETATDRLMNALREIVCDIVAEERP